ncbi:MAG: tetratricopeptide repeat protein [Planctomycetaceae bacterium]
MGLAAASGCQSLPRPFQSQFDRETQQILDGGERLDAAVAEYQSGDIQQALEETRRARESDPSMAAAYELEALLHADLGNRGQHIAALRNIIATNRDSAKIQSSAGRMLYEAGEHADGLAAMQRAVQLAPRETTYARDLAGIYLQDGNLTTAAAVLTAAQIQNPNDRVLPVALARLYETAGEWTLALQHYQQVVQSEPRNALWRRQLAKCAYRLQRYPLAAAEYQRCLETDTSMLSVTDRIEFGDACLRSGEIERARWLFDQLAEQGHDTHDVCVLRGVCALRSNNPALAEQIFSQAADRWPNDTALELLLNNSRVARSQIVQTGVQIKPTNRAQAPTIAPSVSIPSPSSPPASSSQADLLSEPTDAEWLAPRTSTPR